MFYVTLFLFILGCLLDGIGKAAAFIRNGSENNNIINNNYGENDIFEKKIKLLEENYDNILNKI